MATRALARALVPWRGQAAIAIGEAWIEVDLTGYDWAEETEPQRMLRRLADAEFAVKVKAPPTPKLGLDPFYPEDK